MPEMQSLKQDAMGEKEMMNMKNKLSAMICFLAVMTVLLFQPGSAAAEYNFSSDADAVERAADSVFMLEVYDTRGNRIAVGSGFVIFQPDLMATNYHVIEDGAYIVAVGDDMDQYIMEEVCAANKKLDLAILRFSPAKAIAPLPYDASDNLKRSQTVVTIGSPAGLKNTVSLGNISAFFEQDSKNWIQFTAPISSGSSGGVLLNDQGKVIGITTATYATAQNVNLAVRVSTLVDLYNQWDGHSVRRLSQVTGQAGAHFTVSSAPTESNGKVWITRSGKKYHNNPTCSKMKSPVEIDLLEAIENGYEPCGKCYK